MKRPLVAGNWKMNHTSKPARQLAQQLKEASRSWINVDVAIFPPFVWLHELAQLLEGSSLSVGAQNCHTASSGAFTGEISASMIADAGASMALVGHSERRQYFAEDDALVLNKAQALLQNSLTPVICIGETLEERDAERTFDRLKTQLEQGVLPLGETALQRLVLAYEPVWAIGTGRTATPEQAQEVHAYIRTILRKHFAEKTENVRILYGGSVKPDNALQLMQQPDVDGFLVGGASLKFDSFQGIILAAQQS